MTEKEGQEMIQSCIGIIVATAAMLRETQDKLARLKEQREELARKDT